LATSQFWILANLVFNVREAKRVFGFIGTGAIIGGILGGYLTTLLAPIIGNENLVFIAAFFLVLCIPLSTYIWNFKIVKLNSFKYKKRVVKNSENAFKLIKDSKHLKYLALVIGIGVITAKLVEYQFSYIASIEITDSDELAAFFGFWLSTFTLVSLCIQLFLTNKIVGVWGVGMSLLILPILIFVGGVLFIMFPELWVVIILRGIDASLKQSINKSAVELISLPIPFQIKKKTKSFIDVVVDSVATGIAGCLLIFFIKGLDVAPIYIMLLIMSLTLVWALIVFRLRKEYFNLFKNNILRVSKEKTVKPIVLNESFITAMLRVFKEGDEREILYMLGKTLEINDERLNEPISELLTHNSKEVKLAALNNLYFIDKKTIHLGVLDFLKQQDKDLVIAALEYLLQHAETEEQIVFEEYLDHSNPFIAKAALICLAKETKDNPKLKHLFNLNQRIKTLVDQTKTSDENYIDLLQIIGYSEFKEAYSVIYEALENQNDEVQKQAIKAAGLTMYEGFIDKLLEHLPIKEFRETTIMSLLFYGQGLIPLLSEKLRDNHCRINIKNLIPRVVEAFNSQVAVDALIHNFKHVDELSIRLECVTSLTRMKENNQTLDFKEKIIGNLILDECKLYNSTIDTMQVQLLVHYLRRKKIKIEDEEMSARKSLLELLERRLENGLVRIFRLLELKYPQEDIRMAYKGILSGDKEHVENSIEFLDMILNPSLKSTLIPIIEASATDITSEEVIENLNKSNKSEYECFKNILNGRDAKLKLATLFLISKTKDAKYGPLLKQINLSKDKKIDDFAKKVVLEISENS
jgi:AAA family ATP:ADP antiporter